MSDRDIIIIDDILDDPSELIDFSKTVRYYSWKEDSIDKPSGNWAGYRSDRLAKLNQTLFEKTINNIITKIFIRENSVKVGFNYNIPTHLHYLTEENQFQSSWIHPDNALYTGVLFLSENPKENTGTQFFDESKRLTCAVENRYNRLVLFNSALLHSAQGGYGVDVSDSRLSLAFFVLRFSIHCEDFKS